MVSISFIFLLGSYLMGFSFFTYFCIIADPDESRLAHLFTVKIPEQLSSKLTKMVGPEVTNYISDAFEYTLVFFYLIVVGGSWAIIFTIVYPWIDASSNVSNYHKYLGVFVFALCFQSWRFASGKSPGIITAHTIPKYDNYPYDNVFYVEGKICPTVGIPKLPRSKFDRYSGVHIARFDHFCGWLHNPIGEENYRWFLLFLAIHFGMCLYGFVIIAYLFLGEIKENNLWQVTFFNTATNTEIKADYWIIFQFLFQRHQLISSAFVLMGAMVVTLGLFLAYHCWIASRGMTTNETVKWSELKKWHKQETKRFKEAVKAGIVTPDGEIINKPQIIDGDVTCSGGTTSSKAEKKEKEQPIMNPGPMPMNIYNFGLVTNWMDILYPRSLRQSSLQRYRLSQQGRTEAQDSISVTALTKPKTS
jgi:palmitoyltransferase